MKQILVIEDDVDFNQVLCKALSREGYGVLSAYNGNEGIKLYRQNLSDLVITDILMPDKNGIEVIEALKEDYPDVKIIAISGGGLRDTGREYLRLAQVACNIKYTISKPFGRDHLFHMVKEILG